MVGLTPPGAAYIGFCSPPLEVRLEVFPPEARRVLGPTNMVLWEILLWGEVRVSLPASGGGWGVKNVHRERVSCGINGI